MSAARVSLTLLCASALTAAPLVGQGRVSSAGGRGGGTRSGVGGAPAASRGGLPPITTGGLGSRALSSPGLPALPPRTRTAAPLPASPTEPAPPRRGVFTQPDRERGVFPRGRGGRVPSAGRLPRGNNWRLNFPIYYPIYGGYQTPWVIEVDSARVAESSATHVITVPSSREPARPVRSKVYEVRPVDEDDPQGEVEMTPIGADESVADEEPLILVALKDGTIYATSDRWIEGDDLRFVGLAGEERIVALSDVDMRLSAQLNRERGAAFVLEAR